MAKKQDLRDWKTFTKEMKLAIKANKGEFPSRGQLLKMKKSSLVYAISKYHGGKYVVMERIGYYEAKRRELATELEEILNQIDGP